VAAFHRGVKVAHNEAGLRSFDLKNPFPEEANRKWISQIADLHFAPTSLAQEALHREGVDGAKIHLTGNTGVDALLWTLSQKAKSPRTEEILGSIEKKNLRPVFVTAHRRENADAIDVWFKSLASLLEKTKDLYLIYPMHPNNLAKTAAEQWLKGHDRVLLCEPFDYLTTCQILAESAFAVTDSGGIQEEGASLGIPVVVCRKTTERMEAVNVGLSKIADPSSSEQMWAALEWADQMSRSKAHQLKGLEYLRNNSGPFGDGLAAEKIANLLHEQV
jgi:UDP-N-acetylglucosamine 2-epimerase (non-hydrolysing)